MTADLERVKVSLDGRLVADHRRAWGRGVTITDQTHVDQAAKLRAGFQQHRRPTSADQADMVRDLADYDKAFGLDQMVGA